MKHLTLVAAIAALSASSAVLAHDGKKGDDPCKGLPSHSELSAALSPSVGDNGGLNFNMWATVVSADGTVCAVTKTGDPKDITDIWLGSRVISAQKANTANAFSISGGLALSTANLYSAVQPGGSLFGLQFSNPVDTRVGYSGNDRRFGSSRDPMVGRRIGGVNVFGGGLALYDEAGNKIGAVGVSGDTSCADHNVAWRVRDALGLDYVPAGLSGLDGDNIIYDTTVDSATGHTTSTSGFGHPTCLVSEDVKNLEIVTNCPLNNGNDGGCDSPTP